MPEAQPLALLRRDVDRKSHKIKHVLTDPGLRKEFLGGIPKDEKKAVKAFVNQNTENALKTKPKVSCFFTPHLATPGIHITPCPERCKARFQALVLLFMSRDTATLTFGLLTH